MKNNQERKYLINTRSEFGKLAPTGLYGIDEALQFKQKFISEHSEYVDNREKALANLNKLIQNDKVAPGVITNFDDQVLHGNNFTGGIIVNEKFVNCLSKKKSPIKNVNEFIKSDKLIFPNGKEKDLKLIFLGDPDGETYSDTYIDLRCIKNATEIHEVGCDFILLVDEMYFADNSIDDVCVLFEANVPTKNIKQLLSKPDKFRTGAFKNISVDVNIVTFNISEPDKKKLWWIQKIPRWLPKFLKSFLIWLSGLSKKSFVIDDHELLDMLKERIEKDNKNNETKETDVNGRGLLITTRENGILKERFVSHETDQKVANAPKLRKPSEKEEQIKK